MSRIGPNPPKTEITPEDLKLEEKKFDSLPRTEDVIERLIPKEDWDKAKTSKNSEKNLEGQLNRATLEQAFAKVLADPGFTPKKVSDQGLGDPGFIPKGGQDRGLGDPGFIPRLKPQSGPKLDLPVGDPGFIPKNVRDDKGLGDPGFTPTLKPKNEPEPRLPNMDPGFTPRGVSEKEIGDPGFTPKLKPDHDLGDPGFIPKLKK